MPFREFRGYSFAAEYEKAVDKMFRMDRAALEKIPDGESRKPAIEELEKTRKIYQSVYKRDVHEELKNTGDRRLGYRATSSCLMMMLYRDEPM